MNRFTRAAAAALVSLGFAAAADAGPVAVPAKEHSSLAVQAQAKNGESVTKKDATSQKPTSGKRTAKKQTTKKKQTAKKPAAKKAA